MILGLFREVAIQTILAVYRCGIDCPYNKQSLENMSSTHASLDAAATERKARLAKLKSLKRKQPDSYNEANQSAEAEGTASDALDEAPSIPTTYLSGRNYDPTTRGPKLGFEQDPTEDQETLEDRAAQIAEEATRRAQQEEKEDKPIDLFKLQPKNPIGI